MPIVVPTPPTALPTPPTTASPTDFDQRADSFLTALPAFQTQTNQQATDTYTNALYSQEQATSAAASAVTASTAAVNAAASAQAASTAGNASQYSSSTTYNTIGQAVYSPINFQTYRRKTTGSIINKGDPSIDVTNWTLIGSMVPDYYLQGFGVI